MEECIPMIIGVTLVLQHMLIILNQPVNLIQLQCRDMETIQHMGLCQIHQKFGLTLYGIFHTQELNIQESTLELIPNVGTIS